MTPSNGPLSSPSYTTDFQDNSWKLERCPLALRISLALISLVFLILVGGSEDTIVRCDVLGLCVGFGAIVVFGFVVVIFFARKLHGSTVMPSFIWQQFLHLLCVCAAAFLFFAFVSILPIFLLQTLASLAAASFAMAVGSILLRIWWKRAYFSPFAERFGLFASIASWSSAYLVLLLHREVEGHFAGLSAHLSREEHLVLFGFGGFLISTALWFLALLLPCGRRALQGKKVEVKEDSVSRYPSKEEPAEEEADQHLDTVVEIKDVSEETLQHLQVEGAEIPEEPLEDASMHCVTADLPGEVSPSSDEEMEEKPAAKPVQSGAAPFPFPRGPSRPRRRCEEAWSSPSRHNVQSLSAVPEGDEDTEGDVPETLQVTRLNVRAFLAKAVPVPLKEEQPDKPTCDDALEADLDVAPEASLPEADSPHVPPAPCEDLPVSPGSEEIPVSPVSEEIPSHEQLARPTHSEIRKRHWRKVLRPQTLGLADISLSDVGRAAVVSVSAHACAGLILLLGGYIIVVILALLSVKILFLLAGWLDKSRIPDPEPCQVTDELSTLTPEISVASTSPTASPLAKVPEAYAASWGFFMPDRPKEVGDADRADRGTMPPVLEEDIPDPKTELGAVGDRSTRDDVNEVFSGEPSNGRGANEADQGAHALRKTAQHAERPGGARPGRRRPGPEALPESEHGSLSVESFPMPGGPSFQEEPRRGGASELLHVPHFPSPPQNDAWNEIIRSSDSAEKTFPGEDGQSSTPHPGATARCNASPFWVVAAFVCTPAALFVIAGIYAALLFFVFIFDLVFIEKYAASSLSRHFILAAVNATCLDSHRLSALGSFTRPSECAREVMRSTTYTAFSMGPLIEGARACHPQEGVPEASFIDMFYDGASAGPLCSWMSNPGFDFFVIEKHRPCSVLGRGTSLVLSNATAFSHRISDDLPFALAIRCHGCSVVMQRILDVAHALLDADAMLHQLLSAATPGFHRLGAAAFALGAAVATLLLVLLDVYSLLAVGREALSLRLGVPLLTYATANILGQVLEQLVILFLHCVIMAGMSFQLELANDFWPELHCTWNKEVTESEHNAWHQTVRWTGTALVFFAAAVSILLAATLLGGFTYRAHNSLPRWAVSLACPRDIKLSRFAASPSLSECRHENLAVDPDEFSYRVLARPLLGALASLGIWHRSSSVAFQVVKRQDWYLPSMPDTAFDTSVFPSDCVSWASIASATSNSLSVSWLLLPYGGLPARASLYLNERILFAAGTDGGCSADEPDHLAGHVLEDSGPIVHMARWAAASGHLVTLLLLLTADFLDLSATRREKLIVTLLLVGASLSALRSIMALGQTINCFLRRQALVFACRQLLQDSLPSRVVQSHTRAQQKTHPRSRSEEEADALGIQPWRGGQFLGKTCQRGSARLPARSLPGERDDDCLSGLTSNERERVVLACRDLLQLDWVKSAQLPGQIRSKLVAARSSRSSRVRLAEELRGRQHVANGWIFGALLLALREVAEEDLCAQNCALEAKMVVSKHLRQHCTLQAARLQLWLQAHAKSQAARWAAALWNSGAVGDILEATGQEQEARRSLEEEDFGVKTAVEDDRERELSIEEGRSSLRAGKSDGFNATAQSGEPSRAAKMRTAPWKASDAPQSFRMLFAVTQQGLVRISGHWAAGGREILPEQKASVNITSQAEVVLHWPRSGVSSSDVQVEFISHQIWPPLPPLESGSPMTKRSERQPKSALIEQRRRRLGTAWAEQKELRWQQWWPGYCRKTASATAAEEDRMDLLWRIQCGVEWGDDAQPEPEDKDGAKLFTELGCLRWSPPVALPALDPFQRLRPRWKNTQLDPRSTLRFSQIGRIGGRIAVLVGNAPVGLLGPVAKVPQQDPDTLPDDLCQAAEAAAWAAASAAAVAPKAAMRSLEVALRWNPQQLPSAFFGAVYAGSGGLTQAELQRQSWLMAAAARKMRSIHQAQLRSTMIATGKCSEALFWTACPERKRWLRNSERTRMGLTFLGQHPLQEQADEAADSDSCDGIGLWHDPVSPHISQRNAHDSRRNSEGSLSTSSDKVIPFSRPSTPPVIITEVDGPDGDFHMSGGSSHVVRSSHPGAGAEGHNHKHLKEFLDKAAKNPDMSELAKALEEARQGAVEAKDLSKMELYFEQLMTLQRAALGLLEAIQSGSIRQLSSRLSMARELGLENAAFPDATGMGVVQLAAVKLEEEKAAVPLRLDAALQAFARKQSKVLGVGMIALQRCIDQARAAEIQDHVKIYKVEAKLHLLCERKREIALLKAAMVVEDAWLLKAATEECRQRFGSSFGVDLTLAKCQLEIWEKGQEEMPVLSQERRPSFLRLDKPHPQVDSSADSLAMSGTASTVVEEKADAALRAVMFHEPPQAELLRLAIARARRVGVELEQAEQLLQDEREVEQALEQLRRASAARDVRALRRAIADCADVGVDQRLLMPATTQLCEALSELLRRAQQHGLAVAILDELDRERQELRCSVAETQSGLRTICRVRPPLAQELHEALRMNAGLMPVLRRVDRRTLEVALDGSYATCDFSAVLGPESTQAQVYGELTGLAQAAIDGRDVGLIACGPPGAGTSFTLCGSAEQPGLLPRLLDELFSIKARERWRSEIHFDVQALEIADNQPPIDLLTDGNDTYTLPQILARRPCYGQGQGAFAPIQLEGAATRRLVQVQEAKDLAQEIWQRPCRSDRQAVLILHIRRINRHTGVVIRTRLLAVDLAGKRSAAVDRTVSQAIATSVALRRKSTGIAMSTWSPTAVPEATPGSGSQVLTTLLQDCFSADRGRIALVICLPPTAPDREKVLSVLEALGLRQSWVETAETRAERRFSPPEPLEPGIPQLPPSPVLLQKMASSPANTPKNSVSTNAFGSLSFDSKLSEEDL